MIMTDETAVRSVVRILFTRKREYRGGIRRCCSSTRQPFRERAMNCYNVIYKLTLINYLTRVTHHTYPSAH